MDRRMVSTGLVLSAASLGLAPLHAWADDDDDGKLSVTVSFGAGLNTAQPGNAANHHILPSQIKVRKGGVVNFVVGGFHQLVAYKPGVTQAAIAANLASQATPPFFINFDLPNALYVGIAPAGGPPPVTPATANPSNAGNRVESVSFAEAGDYLVICNVRPHFVDGMWAIVKVR
jgi:plastocyanin